MELKSTSTDKQDAKEMNTDDISKIKEEESSDASSSFLNDSENETLADETKVKATRKDLQISRRLFHMANGFIIATAYGITFSHQQIVYFCGTIASVLYLLDQVRIAYPERIKKFERFSKYLLRAEEQLKESAAVPYIMANLLTIITFPKIIAISAIYTLAFADPLSAIIGIRFGKHRIVEHKTIEGSAAFFITTFLSIFIIFSLHGITGWEMWVTAFGVAFIGTCFEMIPLKLDDNLTIPLFTAFLLWIFCATLGIAA
ncbi:MAG: hypothetical protein KAG61_07435 [Bacteriovoracaceae bacterium]|nr:hypothetical protein [Bacteriovoracaceae bacterium]